jgi:hypothetical protein
LSFFWSLPSFFLSGEHAIDLTGIDPTLCLEAPSLGCLALLKSPRPAWVTSHCGHLSRSNIRSLLWRIEFATRAALLPSARAPKKPRRQEDIVFILFKMIFDVASKQRALEKRFCGRI